MKQIETAVEDRFPAAVKIGMLKTHDAVRGVASAIERFGLKNVVLDPVLRASSGGVLLDPEAARILLQELVPKVDVVTPNLDEAFALAGRPVETVEDAEEASRRLRDLGPAAVVTGGHFPDQCVDVLCDGKGVLRFPGERLKRNGAHGSGCVFSSALATALGLGAELREAVGRARTFTREAIDRGYGLGAGTRVVDPLAYGSGRKTNRVAE